MSLEDDDFSDVVRDTPSESSEVGIADLARVGQEKTDDQKDKEEAHSEMRKLGKTPSSKDLPQVDWAFTEEGTLVIQFQDKLVLKQVAKDDPIMAKELAGGGMRAEDIISPGSVSAVEGAVGDYEREHTPQRRHEAGDGEPGDRNGDKNGERGGEKDGEQSADLKKDAEAIKKATDGLGTDEEAVFKALEGKSPEQIKELKAQFGKGNELEQLLKDELSGKDLERALKALNPDGAGEHKVGDKAGGKDPGNAKPADAGSGEQKGDAGPAKGDSGPKGEGKQVDAAKMASDADKIHDAKGTLNDDEDKVWQALEGKNAKELAAMEKAFQDKYGVKMEDYMNSFLDNGAEKAKLATLLAKARADTSGDAPAAKPSDKPREGVTTIDKPAEADPAKLKEIHDDPKVKAERDALEKDLKNLPPEQQARMKENMEKFEKRAAMQDPPMKPEEVAKTLKEIRLLVETPDKPGQPLTKAERINIADQVMKHAADPTSIDQGANNTCNVSTVESRMFTKEPSKAAEMIRQLSTEGIYVTHSKPPITVELDRNKLKAGAEEANNPPHDGDRSHASKIFQEGAIAVSHERHGVKIRDGNGKVVAEYPPGSVEYRKGDASPGSKPPNETGEQLIDKKTGKPIQDADKHDVHGPALDDDHIVDTYNDITGADPPERGVYIVNDNYVAGDGKNVERVKTEEDLKKQLEAAKGPPSKFPIIVGVNTGQEPFFTDSNGGAAGGSGGGHVVTITDYDPKTGTVKMDNQWGKSSDHSLSVHDLHKAMMPTADAVKELEKDVAKNRADGVVDRGKELELLRLKHNTGQMTDAEYDKHVIFVGQQAVKEAQKTGGVLDKQTQEELQAAIKSIQDGKNGETRMQAVRIGMDADVVNRISKQDNPFVGDLKLPDNYATKDMESEADKIHDAKGTFNDDEDKVYKALEGKSPEEIKQMEDAFQKKYGMPMEKYINSFMDEGPEQEKVKALLAKAHGTATPESGAAPAPGAPAKGDTGGDADSRSFASLPEGSLASNIGGGALKGDSGPKGGGGDAPAVKGDNKGDVTSDNKPKEGGGDAKLSPESENVMKHLKDSKVPMSPEKEAQMRKDLAEIDRLPPEQRKKVLESIDKIATTDTKITKPEDRAELAASLAHNIAHPEDIRQGQKETCVAANIEKTLAKQHPDQYADMMAQFATKGEYTLPPGKDGKPPDPPTLKAQLDPDGTLADKSDPTGARNGSSEIMQTAIINLALDKGESYSSVPPNIKGPDGKDIPNPALKPTVGDTNPSTEQGERVTRKVFDPEATRLGVKDGTEIKEPFAGLTPDAKEKIFDKLCPQDGYEGRLIKNPDDLGKAWKDNGGPPLNVGVRMDASFLDKGSQAAGTHAITITHMEFGPDGKPTKIYYDNPSGGADHSYPNGKPVPADEFVKAMQSDGRRANPGQGNVESWDQPLRATVRTDNKGERQDKKLENSADDFNKATTKEAMLKALEGKSRAEIEEMDRISRLKTGRSLSNKLEGTIAGSHKQGDRDEVYKALKGTDTSFSNDPRRPPGLQEFSEKELKKLQDDDGDVKGLDWRETKSTKKNADGTTTSEYEGELETGVWDNGFKASETRDAEGRIVASKITYDSGMDQKFVGPQGTVDVKDVKTVETKKDANGNDVTTVTDTNGKVHTFVVDSKRNSVISYKKPA